TDQPTATGAVLLYPKTVAAAPRTRPKSRALASRKRCQRWLKSGTRRRLLRLLAGRRGLSGVLRVGSLQHDDGDPPARSLAVFVEAGHLPRVLPVEALVVVLAVDDPGSGFERLAQR